MVGQVITNYEPSVVIEGVVRGGKPEDQLITNQINAIRILYNVVNYPQYKEAFFNAVMVLDALLILKGKDAKYDTEQKKLKEKYKIGEIKEIEEQHIKFAIELFKEQLSFMNRQTERDTSGELEVNDEMLSNQEEIGGQDEQAI
jgi:hypothetical protein